MKQQVFIDSSCVPVINLAIEIYDQYFWRVFKPNVSFPAQLYSVSFSFPLNQDYLIKGPQILLWLDTGNNV